MRLLLDTHALLWALGDPGRLTTDARAAIVEPDNDVYVSAVNALEISIMQALGKLDLPGPADAWLMPAVEATGFEWLDITPDDALAVGVLPWHHRDPFDRLLVAQARQEGLILVTHDRRTEDYGVPILWT